MSPDATTNPFQRGAGSYPPVLAGRQAELAALDRIVEGLRDGSLRQTIHLIQAPRGLGKTVLVQALESRAAESAEGVDIVRLSAENLPALDALARLVTPPASMWRKMLQWIACLSMFGVRIERPAIQGEASDSLEFALAARAKAPLLLAIDEAHVMAPDTCRVLLNTFQNLAGKARCALLLIGTPVLKPFLLSDEVNASFAERVPVFAPGLLSPTDSLQALRVPQWNGWTVDDAVLEEVVADSLGYPFFVQLWGEQLWEAGIASKTVDHAALGIAHERVDAIRADFYAARFDEFERFANKQGIDRDGLLTAVQRIAPHVSAPEAAVTTGTLNQFIEKAGLTFDEATVAKACMIDNGFLTRTSDDWQAAIPSLATYICNHPR